VTLDERFFVVSYGNDARLVLIEAVALRPLVTCQFALGALGGAHLYTVAL
jgi:hypothetical protein